MRILPAVTSLRRSGLVGFLAATFSASGVAIRAEPIFMGIGHLPIGTMQSSGANGVSRDGTVVSGGSQARAIRWTLEGGIEEVGDLPGGGGATAVARAVSGDGAVIVGASPTDNLIDPTHIQAFRWTEAGGAVGLGFLSVPPRSNVPNSVATATSFDGSVIAGETTSPIGTEAFRWTLPDGIVGLGTLDGHTRSVAWDISADGTIVVGDSVSATEREAFRWTESTGMVGLGVPPGDNTFSSALAISDNGRYIAGQTLAPTGNEATLWNEAGEMIGLGDLPGGSFSSEAWAVTDDGSLVVGRGSSVFGFEATIWDPTNRMRSLRTVLISDFGLDLSGWTLTSALDISFDGRTIVGGGRNPDGNIEGWIVMGLPAAIPEPPSLLLLGSSLVGIAWAWRDIRRTNSIRADTFRRWRISLRWAELNNRPTCATNAGDDQ